MTEYAIMEKEYEEMIEMVNLVKNEEFLTKFGNSSDSYISHICDPNLED